jgi:hypothetical protein
VEETSQIPPEANAAAESSDQPTRPVARLQKMPSLVGSPRSLGLGSKLGSARSIVSRVSRESGSTDSPSSSSEDMGATRRLLFPSPRRDGAPKVLGEVAVNVVHIGHSPISPKEALSDQENVLALRDCLQTPGRYHEASLDQELFGTPPNRPSTPPPKGTGDVLPFKTPTQLTPSQHRPITRSVSRTIKSVKSVAKTPSRMDSLLQTPSKSTSRHNLRSSSLLKKRTPGTIAQHIKAHFALDDDIHAVPFESPFTATLQQLLSEANDFTADSSSHGLVDLDLASLPNLESEIDMHHLSGASGTLDFSQLFSTDVMPSSPPLLRSGSGSGSSKLSGITLTGSGSGGSGGAAQEKTKQPASSSQEEK